MTHNVLIRLSAAISHQKFPPGPVLGWAGRNNRWATWAVASPEVRETGYSA